MDKKIDAKAFEAFAEKAFKLTAEEMASLYNEAGELTDFSLIETKDAERIKKLSGDSKNQYSRGLKEATQKLEKEIKEKYEVESDLIGVDLIDHIIETKTEEVKGAEGDILKNPEVIKLVNQHAKDKKIWDKEWQTKLDIKEKEVNEANLFKEVESVAIAEFDNLNPILPEDAKKAKALKDILINELKKYKHQKDGDNISVLSQDGTVLKDQHGYPITFDAHVKNIAEKYFDFKKAEDRSSPGNKESGQTGTKKIYKPKDDQEYVRMMQDNSLTSEERIGIMKLHTNTQ